MIMLIKSIHERSFDLFSGVFVVIVIDPDIHIKIKSGIWFFVFSYHVSACTSDKLIWECELVFDFSLKQKGKDGLTSVEYGDVAIGDYLDGAQITNGRSIESFRLEVKKADGKYPYYNEATGVFSIPVTFKVKTNNVLQYSNYRIYASADILKDSTSQKVAISAEKAFITYTVAKININGIWQKAGS